MANTTIPSELIQADVALGGSPTTTTQSAGNNTTKLATTAFVTTAVNNLIASAPGTMDTLNEIAAALNDDPDFTTTVNNAIATKLPLAGGTMTGNIAHASDFTIDAGGDIILDAGGNEIKLKTGGTEWGQIYNSSSDLAIYSAVQDKDIKLQGNDGGSVITALTLDMSAAGAATFNSNITTTGLTAQTGGTAGIVDVASFNASGNGGSGRGTGILIKAPGSSSAVSVARIAGLQNEAAGSANNAALTFQVAASNGTLTERMRIDSSGKLLVGKTSSGVSGVGAELRDGAANYCVTGTSSGHQVALFNRTSSDGEIVAFRKDNTAVGSIGVIHGNNLFIGAPSHSGLQFGTSVVYPTGGSTGDANDATLDIGASGQRFKNLYLSGNAYVGNAVTSSTDGSSDLKLEGNQHIFRKGVAGSYVERMRIASNGRISMGTTTANAGLTVANGDIRTTAAAVANDANSFSMSQESSGGTLCARGPNGSTRGIIQLSVNKDNGGDGIVGLFIANDGNPCVGKTTSDINTQGFHVISSGTYSGTVYSGITGSTAGSTYHLRDTTNNTWKFYVTHAGVINATSTSITSLSDERLKENIINLETGLSEVMSLKPRRFDWKEGEGSDAKNVAGFIAQEVETVLPDLIDDFMHDDLEDAKSVKMGDMIPTLVKAIQEQQTQIEELKKEVQELKSNG